MPTSGVARGLDAWPQEAFSSCLCPSVPSGENSEVTDCQHPGKSWQSAGTGPSERLSRKYMRLISAWRSALLSSGSRAWAYPQKEGGCHFLSTYRVPGPSCELPQALSHLLLPASPDGDRGHTQLTDRQAEAQRGQVVA